MQSAQTVLSDPDIHPSDICSYLKVGSPTHDGHYGVWYCDKFSQNLPNEMVAVIYCCQFHHIEICYIEIARKNGLDI